MNWTINKITEDIEQLSYNISLCLALVSEHFFVEIESYGHRIFVVVVGESLCAKSWHRSLLILIVIGGSHGR